MKTHLPEPLGYSEEDSKVKLKTMKIYECLQKKRNQEKNKNKNIAHTQKTSKQTQRNRELSNNLILYLEVLEKIKGFQMQKD